EFVAGVDGASGDLCRSMPMEWECESLAPAGLRKRWSKIPIHERKSDSKDRQQNCRIWTGSEWPRSEWPRRGGLDRRATGYRKAGSAAKAAAWHSAGSNRAGKTRRDRTHTAWAR